MQTYKLKNKENYKYFVKHYLEVMKEEKQKHFLERILGIVFNNATQ